MDKKKKLREALRLAVAANPNFPVSAVVKSVEGDTCTVILEGGLDVDNVRLKATVGGGNYIYAEPKPGSNVLLLSADGTADNFTVIKVDQAQKFFYVENGFTVEIDGITRKLKVESGNVSLKDVFQQLTDLLLQLKVYTPAGPSGTPLPDSVVRINQFETDFKKILK